MHHCWRYLSPQNTAVSCSIVSKGASAGLQAWTLSGDSYTPHPGDRPWIAEMYGYSYGAAKAGIAHEWVENALLYPGDATDCTLAATASMVPMPISKASASMAADQNSFGLTRQDAALQGGRYPLSSLMRLLEQCKDNACCACSRTNSASLRAANQHCWRQRVQLRQALGPGLRPGRLPALAPAVKLQRIRRARRRPFSAPAASNLLQDEGAAFPIEAYSRRYDVTLGESSRRMLNQRKGTNACDARSVRAYET